LTKEGKAKLTIMLQKNKCIPNGGVTMASDARQQTTPEPADKDNLLADHHHNKLEEIHQELTEITDALLTLHAMPEPAAPRILKLIVDDLGSLTDDVRRHLEGQAPIRDCNPEGLRGSDDWESFWYRKINNLLEQQGH